MAGESARRTYEKVRDERRDRLHANRHRVIAVALIVGVGAAVAFHVLIGAWWIGLVFGLLSVSSLLLPSDREVAWRKGAEGEQAVGRALEHLSPTARVLHDRLIPGSRANIDHILVTTAGVWTVDAKNYTGELETRARGTELWVKGRNRSKLLDQALRQQAVVERALAAEGLGHVRVRASLCFIGVEWPLLFKPKQARGVALVSTRRLKQLVDGTMVIPTAELDRVADALDRALRPATAPATARPATTQPAESGPAASAPPPAPPRRPGVEQQASAAPAGVTVSPWKRYGKNRLYVNAEDGTTLGYLDLDTDTVVPAEEHHRPVVVEAIAAYRERR